MEHSVHMTLWCKRGDKVFDAYIWIGLPRQIGEGDWVCDWSLGKLLIHEGAPLRNINSMMAMLSAINFVGVFLNGRVDEGDQFFFDEALSEPVEEMSGLFPELKLTNGT